MLTSQSQGKFSGTRPAIAVYNAGQAEVPRVCNKCCGKLSLSRSRVFWLAVQRSPGGSKAQARPAGQRRALLPLRNPELRSRHRARDLRRKLPGRVPRRKHPRHKLRRKRQRQHPLQHRRPRRLRRLPRRKRPRQRNLLRRRRTKMRHLPTSRYSSKTPSIQRARTTMWTPLAIATSAAT